MKTSTPIDLNQSLLKLKESTNLLIKYMDVDIQSPSGLRSKDILLDLPEKALVASNELDRSLSYLTTELDSLKPENYKSLMVFSKSLEKLMQNQKFGELLNSDFLPSDIHSFLLQNIQHIEKNMLLIKKRVEANNPRLYLMNQYSETKPVGAIAAERIKESLLDKFNENVDRVQDTSVEAMFKGFFNTVFDGIWTPGKNNFAQKIEMLSDFRDHISVPEKYSFLKDLINDSFVNIWQPEYKKELELADKIKKLDLSKPVLIKVKDLALDESPLSFSEYPSDYLLIDNFIDDDLLENRLVTAKKQHRLKANPQVLSLVELLRRNDIDHHFIGEQDLTDQEKVLLINNLNTAGLFIDNDHLTGHESSVIFKKPENLENFSILE